MLQVYKNQNMGQAQLNAPQMRQISTGGVAGLMPTDNIVMGKKAMGAIFDAMAERQRIQDNTDLAAASSELQKQVIAFQSQYRQQNMGRDARDAGQAWAQNVGELAGKIGEQFQGRPELQQRFKAAADEMALRSYATGFTYADQEEAKYRDATTKEKLAILGDAIGTGTPMDIATAKQDYEATLALLYPGRNLQPELMAADRLVAGGLIDRALAEGDIREARALYKEQRDQLGKDAPSYLSKIDAKQEALEKKAEAAQKEAEAAAFEKSVVSMTAEIGKQVAEYGGDVDQQTAKAFELTADIKDEKQKAEVRKRLAADIKERDTKHKAKVTLEVAEGAKWIAQTGEDDTSLTTSDQLAAIDLLNVSDDAKAVLRQRVSDRIEGKENKAASAANLRVFRAMWDNENGMSPERARAVMLDLNLNAEDTAKAMEYEGRASEYSQARIEPLVRSVIDKNMPAEEVTKYYNALLTLIPAGDKWDDKAIKKALYDLKGVGTVSAGYDDGEEVRKSSTYRDSILSGEQDSFLPDIPAETVPLLNREISGSQPWFMVANAEIKELMRKVWYYQKYLGKNVVLDESEQKLVEEAKETYYARMGAR